MTIRAWCLSAALSSVLGGHYFTDDLLGQVRDWLRKSSRE